MKKEKIEELFQNYHTTCYDAMEARHVIVMMIDDFTKAINQAELEWYKKLENRLSRMNCDVYRVISERMGEYIFEIQNKIKELDNDR